ncbi:TPA: SdrH family protein [Staphylococcus pseudintermedius]
MVEHKKEHRVKRLFKLGIGSTSILCVVSPLLLTHDVVQAADINNSATTLNTLRATSSSDQTAHMDDLRSPITSNGNATETPLFNEITAPSTDETDAPSMENAKPNDEVPATEESESTTPSTEEDTSIEEPHTEEVPSHEENQHHNDPSQEGQPSQPEQPGTKKDGESGEQPNQEDHQKPNQPNKDKPSKDENKKPDKGDKPTPPPKVPNRPDQKDDGSNNTSPPATDNGGNSHGGTSTGSNGGGGSKASPQPNEPPSNSNAGNAQQNGSVASTNHSNQYGTSAYDEYAGFLNNNYKYNPLFKEEVARLSQFGSQDHQDIASLSRKAQFSQNAFLDDLQQSTDYFRYQYFNPLSTEQYYHRLDKQVLALVTGELGSMPDFKKSGDKSLVNKHQQDKVKKIEQHGENFNTHHMKNMKEGTEKSLSYKPMIYIGIVMIGFVGLISMILWKRLHHFWK